MSQTKLLKICQLIAQRFCQPGALYEQLCFLVDWLKTCVPLLQDDLEQPANKIGSSDFSQFLCARIVALILLIFLFLCFSCITFTQSSQKMHGGIRRVLSACLLSCSLNVIRPHHSTPFPQSNCAASWTSAPSRSLCTRPWKLWWTSSASLGCGSASSLKTGEFVEMGGVYSCVVHLKRWMR